MSVTDIFKKSQETYGKVKSTIERKKKAVEVRLEPYEDKIRYGVYSGAGMVCGMIGNQALAKGFRSKILLNRVKYLGTALGLRFAGKACKEKASKDKTFFEIFSSEVETK